MKKIRKSVPTYVKCNCGHVAKDHFQKRGCCNAIVRIKEIATTKNRNSTCGCSWFWPNDRWILKQKKKNR